MPIIWRSISVRRILSDLRQLQGRAALEDLLTQLDLQRKLEEKKLDKRIPLLVKLAPDLIEGGIRRCASDVILNKHMDGVIATNTTLSREGLRSKYRGESGGLSGSPLRLRSEAVLCQVVKLVEWKNPDGERGRHHESGRCKKKTWFGRKSGSNLYGFDLSGAEAG